MNNNTLELLKTYNISFEENLFDDVRIKFRAIKYDISTKNSF